MLTQCALQSRLVETARDRVHLRLGLLESHVRSKSSNDGPETCATRTAKDLPIRIHRVRFPHSRVVVKLEVRRENADDTGGSAVQVYGGAYRVERASETGLPEAMTDHCQTLPLLGLLGREDAPVQG